MMEAERGLGNITEKFLRDIISTTEKGTYICSVQHRSILHTTSKVKNKKGQLSLTNPRDACETFARFM